MSTSSNDLSAVGVSAGYGSTPVLRGVGLTLAPGSAPVGIIGRSGVGKTTLAQVLVGELKTKGGSVTFGGRTVSRLGLRDKKRFGVGVRSVRQNGFSGLDPRVTVERLIEGELTKARKAGQPTGGSVADALEMAMLDARHAPRTVRSLSGGERQRLALAAALATRPDILILDEPTTALDHALKTEVTRRLSAIVEERGIGLLIISHDLELVGRLATSVHVLADGQFVETGSARELLTNPQHPETREIAAAAPDAVRAFR